MKQSLVFLVLSPDFVNLFSTLLISQSVLSQYIYINCSIINYNYSIYQL